MNTRWSGGFAPRMAGALILLGMFLLPAIVPVESAAQDYGLRKADIAIEGMT